MAVGIRREDKNRWERRVPIIPKHIKKLKENHGIDVIVQPSIIRIFKDKDFLAAGAKIDENLSPCSVVFAIKEIPEEVLEPKKTYVFFSHTIKGQKHNMPMLKKMMDLKCNLIDYEKITDIQGRRLLFFGRYAGLAGMIDSLWAYGRKLNWRGIDNPFIEIKQTFHYDDLDDALENLKFVCEKIKNCGFPSQVSPFVIGFAGYGNVSKGAQEVLDVLPVKEITPKELENLDKNFSNKLIYKVVFKEEDMVEPKVKGKKFDLQEYYKNPELYNSVFDKYINKLSILMNCIYWEEKYPRLVTKNFVKKNFSKDFKLEVIGDISIDLNGAIEFTEKVTEPDFPVFVYNPEKDEIIDGYRDEGIVVMAVDNLPCELSKESSQAFSDNLINFVPAIISADFSVDFDSLALPPEIKKAVILHHGKLTPNFCYMNKFLMECCFDN